MRRPGMDAAADDPENPARLINAAANEEQCTQAGRRPKLNCIVFDVFGSSHCFLGICSMTSHGGKHGDLPAGKYPLFPDGARRASGDGACYRLWPAPQSFAACASDGRSHKPQNWIPCVGLGYSYWPDFDSCQLVTANDLMARLEKRSTR